MPLNKSLWVAGASVAALAVFIVVGFLAESGPVMALSDRMTDAGLPAEIPLARLCDALTAALIVAFLVAFVGPALADAFAVNGALQRLRQLRLHAPDGISDPTAFRQALRGVPFLEAAATDYLSAIGSLYDPSRSQRANIGNIPPGGFFGAGSTVDRRLAASLFANFPLAVFGLGLAAGLAQMAAGSVGATAFPGTPAGAALAAAAVALAIAILLKLIHAGILELRYTQAQRLCSAVDALALTARADPLGDFIALNRLDNRELRETVASGIARLEKTVQAHTDDLAQAITASADASGRQIGRVTADALHEPLAALRRSAEQQGEDQRERLIATLTQALDHFSTQFADRHGDQAERLGTVLGALADAAGRLNDNVASGVRTFVTDLQTHSTEVGEHLKETSDAALARIGEMTDKTHGDLDRAVATAGELRFALQDLSVSLGPSFRRLVDIQEQLLATIEQENAASRSLSRAASDMTSVARTQREGLEMIVGLAARLRETAASLQGTAPPPAAGAAHPGTAGAHPPPSLSPERASSLSEELQSLRDEMRAASSEREGGSGEEPSA